MFHIPELRSHPLFQEQFRSEHVKTLQKHCTTYLFQVPHSYCFRNMASKVPIVRSVGCVFCFVVAEGCDVDLVVVVFGRMVMIEARSS